jgi:hypothetical protein
LNAIQALSQLSYGPTGTRIVQRRERECQFRATAGEADAAGPWFVELIPGLGFGLFRAGESLARGFRPAAVVELVRAPWSLAYLPEAAGPLALERCGAILDRWIS